MSEACAVRVKQLCASRCRPSLKKTSVLKVSSDPPKYCCSLPFAFKVLLKQNRLLLVCYAAVSLPQFSSVPFSASVC